MVKEIPLELPLELPLLSPHQWCLVTLAINPRTPLGAFLTNSEQIFMNQIFILQNQDRLFFGKNKEWMDGYDASNLFKTVYKDEAINQMVEISAKDYQQRVKIISCDADEKGLPSIDIQIMPSPLAKVPKAAKAVSDVSIAALEE